MAEQKQKSYAETAATKGKSNKKKKNTNAKKNNEKAEKVADEAASA